MSIASMPNALTRSTLPKVGLLKSKQVNRAAKSRTYSDAGGRGPDQNAVAVPAGTAA